MRYLLVGFVLLAGTAGLFTKPSYAGEQTGPIVQEVTHTIRVPEGGSLEEGIALSNEWRVKVLDKNPHIVSVTYLGRTVSDSEYKLMVLYEYASAEEATKANALFAQLMAVAWPGESGPQLFLEKLWKYIDRSENVAHLYETVGRPK